MPRCPNIQVVYKAVNFQYLKCLMDLKIVCTDCLDWNVKIEKQYLQTLVKYFC